MDYRALLDDVNKIAKDAGAAILEVYRQGDTDVTYKDDKSPLTEADKASHTKIVAALGGLEPSLPVLSEESSSEVFEARQGWERFWLVDPLDGTKEFIKRNGEFTVNIALIEDNKPVLGVVYAPDLGLCYYGAHGVGAYKQQGEAEPVAIHVADEVTTPLKVVASRSHRNAETETFLERLKANEFEPEIQATGSSLKFCLVATGEAHLYPRFGPTMEWDTAAAQCVVECAGGAVVDLAGEPLRYNKPDLYNPFFLVSGSDPLTWRPFATVDV